MGNTTLSSGGYTSLIGDLGCNMYSGILMSKSDFISSPTSTISVSPFMASVKSKLISQMSGLLATVEGEALLKLKGGITMIN